METKNQYLALDTQIGYYQNAKSTKGDLCTLEEALTWIQAGSSKQKIEQIRSETDEKVISALKKNLPAVTWSGIFSERKDNKLVEHSGLIALDFDGIDVAEYKRKLSEWPWTLACWVSPSGKGVKSLVRIADGSKHRQHFAALKRIWKDADSTCANPSRLCFESYDPDLYFNGDAMVFEDIEEEKIPELITRSFNQIDLNSTYQNLLRWMEKKGEMFNNGNRNKFIFVLSSAMCRYGIAIEDATQLLSRDYTEDDFDVAEICAAVKSGYKINKDAFATQLFAEKEEKSQPALLPAPDVAGKIIISDIDLMAMNVTEIPFLLEPLLGKGTLNAIIGKPGLGKSCFTVDLAIAISHGLLSFCGYKINTQHQRALIITTEQNHAQLSFLIRSIYDYRKLQQNGKINFIIDDDIPLNELLNHIHNFTSETPIDLLIMDSWGDLYDGNTNDSSLIRQTLKKINAVGIRNDFTTLLVHHPVKSSYSLKPAMEQAHGGQSLVARCRTVLSLNESTEGSNKRLLTVVKGNLTTTKQRAVARELIFLEEEKHFAFESMGTDINIESIGSNSTGKENNNGKLKKLAEEIFSGNNSLTHKSFCEFYQTITGKTKPSANRDLKRMAELGILIKDEKNWKLKND